MMDDTCEEMESHDSCELANEEVTNVIQEFVGSDFDVVSCGAMPSTGIMDATLVTLEQRLKSPDVGLEVYVPCSMLA